jgi:hypothetical protein
MTFVRPRPSTTIERDAIVIEFMLESGIRSLAVSEAPFSKKIGCWCRRVHTIAADVERASRVAADCDMRSQRAGRAGDERDGE